MSATFVAMKGTAGLVTCTIDGTPYRTDGGGIVYVLQGHQSELSSRGLAAATNAQLAAAGHSGDSTTVTGSGNHKDRG